MSRRQSRWLFVLVGLLAIGATLIYSFRAQAQADSQRLLEEPRAWAGVEDTVTTSMEVLRPLWLPPAFRHHPQVGSDSWGPGVSTGYEVSYCAADCFSSRPTQLAFALNPYGTHHTLDHVSQVRVHGTTGTFSVYRSAPIYEVAWREAGQRYAVFGNRVWPSQLLRAAASLHPVVRPR